MTKKSDSKNLFDFEMPEGLDNDLGGDWESAFQAEDFMLAPDEEAEIFFEKEEGSDDNDFDLAALLDSADSQSRQTASQSYSASTESAAHQNTSIPSFLPAFLVLILTQSTGWFRSRPFYQKILLTGFPVFCIALVAGVLFFRDTTRKFAGKQPPPPVSPVTAKSPEEQQTPPGLTETIPPAEPEKTLSQTSSPPEKNRKKWAMNDFFITAQSKDGKESLLIKVDLSLILLLDPATSLPEEKRTFVRDTIYQFFANRPPDELRRYALARGEMVRNLESWLNKEWPQNPIASFMFDRYQILN